MKHQRSERSCARLPAILQWAAILLLPLTSIPTFQGFINDNTFLAARIETENISKSSSGAMKLSDVVFTQILEKKSMFIKVHLTPKFFSLK